MESFDKDAGPERGSARAEGHARGGIDPRSGIRRELASLDYTGQLARVRPASPAPVQRNTDPNAPAPAAPVFPFPSWADVMACDQIRGTAARGRAQLNGAPWDEAAKVGQVNAQGSFDAAVAALSSYYATRATTVAYYAWNFDAFTRAWETRHGTIMVDQSQGQIPTQQHFTEYRGAYPTDYTDQYYGDAASAYAWFVADYTMWTKGQLPNPLIQLQDASGAEVDCASDVEWELMMRTPDARYNWGTITIKRDPANPNMPEGFSMFLFPRRAGMVEGPYVGKEFDLQGIGWTETALQRGIDAFEAEFGAKPDNLSGDLDMDNLANFVKEFKKLKNANGTMSDEDAANQAVRLISFGRARISVSYDNIQAQIMRWETVDAPPNADGSQPTNPDGSPMKIEVPGDVHVTARMNVPVTTT